MSGKPIKINWNKICTIREVVAVMLRELNRKKQEKGDEQDNYIYLVLNKERLNIWDHNRRLTEFLINPIPAQGQKA